MNKKIEFRFTLFRQTLSNLDRVYPADSFNNFENGFLNIFGKVAFFLCLKSMFQIKTARSLTVDKAMFSVVVFFVKLSGKPKKITTAKRARLDEKATILLR